MPKDYNELWESVALGAFVLLVIFVMLGTIPAGEWSAGLTTSYATPIFGLAQALTYIAGIGSGICILTLVVCGLVAYFNSRRAHREANNIDAIIASLHKNNGQANKMEERMRDDNQEKFHRSLTKLTQQEKEKIMPITIERFGASSYAVKAEDISDALRELISQKADLSGAILRYICIENVNFAGVNLTGASFAGSQLRNVSLAGAVLYETDFSDCKVDGRPLQQTLPVLQIGPLGRHKRMYTVLFFEDGSTPIICFNPKMVPLDEFLGKLTEPAGSDCYNSGLIATLWALKKINKQLCKGQKKFGEVLQTKQAKAARSAPGEKACCCGYRSYFMGEELTREYLMALCKRAIVVPYNPDDQASSDAQQSIDLAYRRLALGTIKYQVHRSTDRNNIWVCFDALTEEQGEDIRYIQMDDNPSPAHRERQRLLNRYVANLHRNEYPMLYIPTSIRLDKAGGKDWAGVRV